MECENIFFSIWYFHNFYHLVFLRLKRQCYFKVQLILYYLILIGIIRLSRFLCWGDIRITLHFWIHPVFKTQYTHTNMLLIFFYSILCSNFLTQYKAKYVYIFKPYRYSVLNILQLGKELQIFYSCKTYEVSAAPPKHIKLSCDHEWVTIINTNYIIFILKDAVHHPNYEERSKNYVQSEININLFLMTMVDVEVN